MISVIMAEEEKSEGNLPAFTEHGFTTSPSLFKPLSHAMWGHLCLPFHFQADDVLSTRQLCKPGNHVKGQAAWHCVWHKLFLGLSHDVPMAFVFADKHSRECSTVCACKGVIFMCVVKSQNVLHTSVQRTTPSLPLRSPQTHAIQIHDFSGFFSGVCVCCACWVLNFWSCTCWTNTLTTEQQLCLFPPSLLLNMGFAELFSRPGKPWTSYPLGSVSWVAGGWGRRPPGHQVQRWFPRFKHYLLVLCLATPCLHLYPSTSHTHTTLLSHSAFLV